MCGYTQVCFSGVYLHLYPYLNWMFLFLLSCGFGLSLRQSLFYVAQVALELAAILLPLPPEFWLCRLWPPYPVSYQGSLFLYLFCVHVFVCV